MNKQDTSQQDQAHSLHEAVSNRDVEMVRSCLASGADPNERDGYGYTPLFRVVMKLWGDPDEERDPDGKIVQVLLEYGADPNAKSYTGSTPAHYAAVYDHLAALELLEQAGADLYALDFLLDADGVEPKDLGGPEVQAWFARREEKRMDAALPPATENPTPHARRF